MKKLIFILLLCITTSAFGQLRQKPMHGLQINKAHQLGDPVAFWPFNEGSGNIVQDLSGNGNNLDITSGVIWVGDYLDFSGAVRVEKTSAIALPNTQGTMTAIVKFDVAPGTKDEAIYCLSDGAAPANSIFLNFGTDDLLLLYCRAGGVGANVFKHNNISAILTTGIFYHIVTTWDTVTDDYKVYVDGISISNDVPSVVGNPSDINKINLGTYGDLSKDLDGQIKIFSVYSRILSASEIAQLYSMPFCMFEGDLTVAQMYDYSGAPPAPSGQFIMIQMTAIPFFVIFIIASIFSIHDQYSNNKERKSVK